MWVYAGVQKELGEWVCMEECMGQDGRPSIVGRRGIIGLGMTKATTNAANFTAAHYTGLLTN